MIALRPSQVQSRAGARLGVPPVGSVHPGAADGPIGGHTVVRMKTEVVHVVGLCPTMSKSIRASLHLLMETLQRPNYISCYDSESGEIRVH